ncbi:uncharacterized protein LOC144040151 isoform X2 [Vanacampus margaritifer]
MAATKMFERRNVNFRNNRQQHLNASSCKGDSWFSSRRSSIVTGFEDGASCVPWKCSTPLPLEPSKSHHIPGPHLLRLHLSHCPLTERPCYQLDGELEGPEPTHSNLKHRIPPVSRGSDGSKCTKGCLGSRSYKRTRTKMDDESGVQK